MGEGSLASFFRFLANNSGLLDESLFNGNSTSDGPLGLNLTTRHMLYYRPAYLQTGYSSGYGSGYGYGSNLGYGYGSGLGYGSNIGYGSGLGYGSALGYGGYGGHGGGVGGLVQQSTYSQVYNPYYYAY
jgi:hypothetical protein